MPNRNGRVVLLSNPRAGHGSAALKAARAVARLAQLGLEVEHIVGIDRPHAEELAHNAVATRPEAFIVVGGDGGVSVAIQALAQSDVPLGIIPNGTGNDTARRLGLPLDDVNRAADIVAAGRSQRIDLGHIRLDDGTERYFIGVIGADYSADVVRFSNSVPFHWSRSSRFVASTLVNQFRLHPHYFTLLTDEGQDLSGNYYIAAVGNMRSYGAGMAVCPHADHQDGMLDLTLLKRMSWARPRLLPALVQSHRGGVIPTENLSLHRVSGLRMQASGRQLFADGDLVGPLPAQISCQTRALSVIVP